MFTDPGAVPQCAEPIPLPGLEPQKLPNPISLQLNQPRFRIGDAVTWKGCDKDLPAGVVGRVTEARADGDVECEFPSPGGGRATFVFFESRLSHTVASGEPGCGEECGVGGVGGSDGDGSSAGGEALAASSAEDDGLSEALKAYDSKRRARRCHKCSAFKPEKAHHCTECGRCIVKMDHHCPWVRAPISPTNQPATDFALSMPKAWPPFSS